MSKLDASEKLIAIVAGLFILSIPCCCLLDPIVDMTTEKTLAAKVRSKEVKSGDNSTRFMVFTDKEVLIVNDSIANKVFDAADVYNKIDANKCYTFTVSGWRFPPLSMFCKAFKATEVKCGV